MSTPPGAPGTAPRWTTSAKSGVGTAVSPYSQIWYTISHGILNEVYAPRLDTALIRDFGLLVTADGYFSDEKRDCHHEIAMIEDGVPAFKLTNTAHDGRYRITKLVVSDPVRQVVLQKIGFEALKGEIADYRVHAIVAPHLVNAGLGNTGWCDDFKGHEMLFAEGRGAHLALASSVPWLARSTGFVGTSDGWQTLSHGDGVVENYQRAEDGNVALTGTIDLAAWNGSAVLALGIGLQSEEAAIRARLSLLHPFESTLERFCGAWRDYQKALVPLDDQSDPATLNTYRTSTSVLFSHCDHASGAIIASLSIPWGSSRGDDNLGGYHLVWPRDLVQTAGALIAAGDLHNARGVLAYLRATQEADGHWVQNTWLDGRPYWNGIQLDETAFPILLYDMLLRANAIDASAGPRYIEMIAHAAGYLIRNGPVTQQDRWEENDGYAPFTLAVMIASLLAAADAMDVAGRAATANYLRDTADGWNERIESWTYACDTDLSRKLDIDGYYMRIGFSGDGHTSSSGLIPIRNRDDGDAKLEAGQLVSPDALALVRFGLRAADDPRILNTVSAVDHLLKRDLPHGSYWYRYNDDGYGERLDGEPFDGAGIGRLWPLLTGERAHYEIAAGRLDEARRLLKSLEASAGPGGMLPEQIWDCDDIPARELYLGRPTGSAMPLVWAHSEHIKLLRSLKDGAVFDMPPQTFERYVKSAPRPAPKVWRILAEIEAIAPGDRLRIELLDAATVRWSADGWATSEDVTAAPTELGTYLCDLPTTELEEGRVIAFALCWSKKGDWNETPFEVKVKSV